MVGHRRRARSAPRGTTSSCSTASGARSSSTRCRRCLDLLRAQAGVQTRARVVSAQQLSDRRRARVLGVGIRGARDGGGRARSSFDLSARELSIVARRARARPRARFSAASSRCTPARRADGSDSFAEPLLGAADWPLEVVIAVTATGEKEVGSRSGMTRSAESSPYYSAVGRDAAAGSCRRARRDRARAISRRSPRSPSTTASRCTRPRSRRGRRCFTGTARRSSACTRSGGCARRRARVFYDRCGPAGQGHLHRRPRAAGRSGAAGHAGRRRACSRAVSVPARSCAECDRRARARQARRARRIRRARRRAGARARGEPLCRALRLQRAQPTTAAVSTTYAPDANERIVRARRAERRGARRPRDRRRAPAARPWRATARLAAFFGGRHQARAWARAQPCCARAPARGRAGAQGEPVAEPSGRADRAASQRFRGGGAADSMLQRASRAVQSNTER